MADQPGTGDAPRRWSFGAAAFDERAMQLFVGGRAVELELKPLEVLRYLLQHPGEAVSKEDLIKAVWPGRIISDSALTSTIAKLREALGEEQDAIHTVHGFGYRLDAEVRSSEGRGVAGEKEQAEPRSMRRLTAIMFTDLVGYSALAHRDEKLAIELLELHRGWVREILPLHGGREIETIGDAFLVEFAGALAAVECALAIQRRFAEHNAAAPEGRRMQLRIGIHAGDVEHKHGKVMGDGVNIASRIHGLAEPGGVCVSEDVQRAVRPHGYRLESLGTPALKNIAAPPELFRMLLDEAQRTPAAGARGSSRWKRPFAGLAAPVRPSHLRWSMAAALVLVAAAATFAIWRSAPRPSGTPSVAILPFENLSAESDSEFFTDGLHDSVIGHLARARNLKVISRTSVMGYRGGTDLKEIARALAVDHVVEGSVQRAGDRLRVTVQLVDAATDGHLWSAEYDRNLADVFAVQADIARQVASAVHAELSPQARDRLQAVPTRDLRAYDLYLKALLIHRTVTVEADAAERWQEAVQLLEEAVRLDPEFALGYALLAQTRDELFLHDNTEERLNSVKQAAETALRLDPTLPDAQLAWARYLYYGLQRYDEAAAILEQALGSAPGNADLHEVLGYILNRRGRHEESLARLRSAALLDPRNYVTLRYYAFHLFSNRRYPESLQASEAALQIAPDPVEAQRGRAWTRFAATGDIEPFHRSLMEYSTRPDKTCWTALWLGYLKLNDGDRDAALRLITGCSEDQPPYFVGAGVYPKELLHAEGHYWAGDHAQARTESRVAIRRLREQLVRRDHAKTRVLLALGLAYAGEAEEALRELDTARRDADASGDKWLHMDVLDHGARIMALLRRDDAALDALEQSLSAPAWGAHVHFEKLRPEWKPFRGNPRFQKLMADYQPKDQRT